VVLPGVYKVGKLELLGIPNMIGVMSDGDRGISEIDNFILEPGEVSMKPFRLTSAWLWDLLLSKYVINLVNFCDHVVASLAPRMSCGDTEALRVRAN
jgi:hypothetical protein